MKALLALVCLFPFYALAGDIAVIVNERNPVERLHASEVTDYFLRKRRHWPDGTPLRFFDRHDEAAERAVFLRDIVGKTPREMELFWIGQKLYTGLSAPTQVGSDSMVASLVARFPGAIGYVSAGFPGRKGVKVVPVQGEK